MRSPGDRVPQPRRRTAARPESGCRRSAGVDEQALQDHWRAATMRRRLPGCRSSEWLQWRRTRKIHVDSRYAPIGLDLDHHRSIGELQADDEGIAFWYRSAEARQDLRTEAQLVRPRRCRWIGTR